jgi:hypothetical protein
LLLGAIATATAPASTMMTIRQYQAKGEFVNILLEVVSLDDAVCLICYTLAITIINSTSSRRQLRQRDGYRDADCLERRLYRRWASSLAGFTPSLCPRSEAPIIV